MKRYHHLLWDRENISHINRHKVIPDEVEQVVFARYCLKRKGKGDKIYYMLGKTDSGRYLFIVLRDLERAVARVITARDMSGSEKRLYKRWLL